MRNRGFTDEQAAETARLRHDELLSWRLIAKALEFGSPGIARRAYRHATWCTGVLPRVAGKAGRPTAGMVAGTEKPETLGATPTPTVQAMPERPADASYLPPLGSERT